MNFWEKIQDDLKKNLQEGLSFVKEGGEAVSQKIGLLTNEGKKKYKVFNLNMKVQDEFAKLGGEIYDLTAKKSKNPLRNRKVISIISRINRLEAQITKLEQKKGEKAVKTIAKKTAAKKTTAKKTTSKRKCSTRTRTVSQTQDGKE